MQNNRPVTRSTKNKLKNLKNVNNVTYTQHRNDQKPESEITEPVSVDELQEQKDAKIDNMIKNDNTEHTVSPVVKGPIMFEIPDGLAFTNFKFDRNAISPLLSKQADKVEFGCNDLVKAEVAALDSKIKIKESPLIECTPEHIKTKSEGESLRRSARLQDNIKKTPCSHAKFGSSVLSKIARTPVMLFKEREGLAVKTPSPRKRTSLTPNPKNFLSKVEDPVAQRIDTPEVHKTPNTPPEVSNSVKHFTKLVADEEKKFLVCCEKWDSVLAEESAPEEGMYIKK